MTFVRTLGILAFFATGAVAQSEEQPTPATLWVEDHTVVFDAADVTLEDFRWIARPIVVFADNAADPRFQQQMALLAMDPEALSDRDMVIITDTDPGTLSAIREELRPRGFMLAILDKDGTILIRKPLPWDIREISANIDKLPQRQQEVEDRRVVPAGR